MYTKFYGLREKPFNITPDSHFLYLSTQHRDALGHLLYGIRERKGFILITGEVGTGKTTLCRALIHEVEDDSEVGCILNTFLSAKELLRAVNDDLIGHSTGGTKKELVDELNRFLLEKHAQDRNVVLLIDECQNLATAVLEQIRMLSNLETEKHKLLQIVMVGQPEIAEKLEKEGLRQLAQRISVSYHLQPLDRRETTQYICHRLRVASDGGDGEAGGDSKRPAVRFSRAALKRIFAYSGGVPRKINIVCDRALLIGFVSNKKRITDGVVRKAIGEIHRRGRRTKRRARRSRIRGVVMGSAVAVCVLVALAIIAHRSGPWIWSETPEVGNGVDRQSPEPAAGFLPEEIEEHGRSSEPGREVPLPRPEEEETTLHTVPEEQGPPQWPEARVAALLAKMWGRPGEGERRIRGEERDIFKLAESFSMKAISCWADVDFLRRANLPCIVRMSALPGGERVLMVLSSFNSNGAVLVDSLEGKKFFTDEEIDAVSGGRVIYFYPAGVAMPPVLAPGAGGSEVADLQDNLKRLGLMTGDENGRYGPKTAEAVRRFQREHGLPQDGIAGRNENIMIRVLRAGNRVPNLAALSGEG